MAHPVSGEPLADLDQNELVLGVGVHGDAGIHAGGDASADGVVDRMLPTLLEDGDFRAGEKVCVLVNNSGALTVMELSILYRAVDRVLAGQRTLRCIESGWGAMPLPRTSPALHWPMCRMDEETSRLYDQPALGAGFVMTASGTQGARLMTDPRGLLDSGDLLRMVAASAADELSAHADDLSRLDAVAGDGDHGVNMTRGHGPGEIELAEAMGAATPAEVLDAVATAFFDGPGGASGALFGSFFRGVAAEIGTDGEFDCHNPGGSARRRGD